RLPPALAARLALASARAGAAALDTSRASGRGSARPVAPARLARLALRARIRRSVVPGRTNGRGLRPAACGRDRRRLARCRGAGDGPLAWPLRTVSERCGAAAAWTAPRDREADRAYSEREEARIRDGAEGVGRVNVRRALRIAGTALAVVGALVLAWVVVVWQWQDPFTALYTHWKQHQPARSYERRFAGYQPRLVSRSESVGAEMRTVEREAHSYRLASHRGQAIGRLHVPRLGLNMI